MKKYFLYMLLAALPLAFTACSDDDDDNNSEAAPELPVPANDDVAAKINFAKTPAEQSAGIDFIEFTETGKTIIKFKETSDVIEPNRLSVNLQKYLNGTYTVVKGSDYRTYTVVINGNYYATVKIFLNGTTFNTIYMEFYNERSFSTSAFELINKKIEQTATTKLCREWTVSSARLRAKGELTYAKDFSGAADMTAIWEYAKSKDSDFDMEKPSQNKIVSGIIFTKSGTFAILYLNDENDYGTWDWADVKNGKLAYTWMEDGMGSKFEKGTATFDVRKGQYAITLDTDVESNKNYELELTFYLK